MACGECGQSHENQRVEYPIGSTVDLAINIFCEDRILLPKDAVGEVTGHCDDGRAIFSFGDSATHTFHYPESCLCSGISNNIRSRIVPLTRMDLRRGRRDVPMGSISLRDFMAQRKIDDAHFVYLCDDDGQCIILKNRNGDTGIVGEKKLLAEAKKVYATGNRDLTEVLEMVHRFIGTLPDEMVDLGVADAVKNAISNGG